MAKHYKETEFMSKMSFLITLLVLGLALVITGIVLWQII
jgi:cytochrome b subunit of formate dehydrogenase